MRIAFLGLGRMGYPMAGHLAGRFETHVWNRTVEKAQTHASEFGSFVLLEPEAASAADVILSCLPTSVEVEQLADQLMPSLRPGHVWVDCTSGDPVRTRHLAERFEACGSIFLDAPVSGGVSGALAGTLTVMVGGDLRGLEIAKSALVAFAAKIIHVGVSGSGMALKAANQALLGLNILALAEVLSGLLRWGVSTRAALEVINASSGRSNVSENLFPERVLGRTFPRTFALGLLAKDVSIAQSMLREANVPSPIVALAEQLLIAAKLELGSDVDHVAAVQFVEGLAGLELGRDA